MKRRNNNTTLVLMAILAFLMGLFLIGAFSLHLRHKAEEEAQAILEQQEAEKQRQEELAQAQAEEEERKQNASQSSEDDKAENMPGMDVEQALGSDAMLAQAVEDLKNAVDQ